MEPTYIVKYNPDKNKGVYMISLVNDPAIEEVMIQMAKENVKIQLAEIDSEKRLFITPVLIPNKKILRIDKETGNPYNIVFPAETILAAQQNFQKRGYQNEGTLEHDITLKLEGITYVESWIKKDNVHDQSVKYGFDLPIGTWFTVLKVESDEVLAKIKSGEITGVSIDGAFELDENINLNNDMNLETILTAIKDGFKSLTFKLGSEVTKDEATTIYFDGDTLAVDTLVFSDETLTNPLADGEYELSDKIITVLDGKVGEISTPQEEASPAETTEEVAMAEVSVEEKVNEIMTPFIAQIAKEVASQLADFKVSMTTEIETIQMTKANPEAVADITEFKDFKSKMFNTLKNNN